ncbi:MAG: polysaccharide biosynthesis tyrosine autokinase, partial [Anaerolineae bacterium]|nr:polysaccharide biosynthesis tyrosine autokinase [Anaerolineae bacterium]
MELREYAQLVRKWLWLILLCTVAAAAAAYVVSKNSTPIYQASTKLLVNQSSSNQANLAYQDILMSQQLARTYANLLADRPVVEATAQRLGLPTDQKTLTSLQNSISVTPIRDTQLLEVKVEGPDPQLIALIANTLPEVFIAQNQQLQLGRVSGLKSSLETEIANVQEDIARTQANLAAATDDAQRQRYEASLAQYRSTLSSLVNNYQQIRLAEVQATNNVVVVKPAVAPQTPIRPRTMTNVLLAAVVGAMIAAGAAFLIEYLDDTIKSPDDVARVSGLSTLGAIARLKDAGIQRQLIAWMHSKAPETEAYRTLRTNIQFSSVDKPVRTLVVTSSGPSEGKSTTAANLAVVMAQTGQKVVLVDADLRRPVLHKTFGVPNNVGSTTALLAGDDVDLQSYLQPTEIDNLMIITSGPIPPNPSELLGSQRMRHIVDRLAQIADMVIFDTPPVLVVTDAAVLSRQTDGVLLIADAGGTREPALAHAVEELRKTGANILGVALNRLDSRSRGYYYY